MGVLPLVVEQKIAGQCLEHPPILTEPGRAMIDISAHDSPSRDEATPGAEVFADPGHDVTQAESLSVASKDSFPQGRVAHGPARLVEAAGRLERCAVDISEDVTAI